MRAPDGREATSQGSKRGIQIPIFYKLMVSMLFVAMMPIILLGIVSTGGAESAISTYGLQVSILIITLVTLTVIVMWSFFLASHITRPIVQLSDLAQRMSTGDMRQTEIPVTSNDEIGELAIAFSKMVNTYQILDTLSREDSG
ncbi:MAG: HAMP domain-containing protein [Methanomicrobiales archaeon]|jgi:HAMP domain-containing protein|nr:HAMP domain-containing protein [Methanomicrobiales archaeon]